MIETLIRALVSAAILTAPAASASADTRPVELVHPLVGTAADGQTFPSVGLPHAMTQWTPQTQAGEAKCVAPYSFAQTRLQGFRGSHFLSGSCTQDYGSFTVMPLPNPGAVGAEHWSSAFARSSEKATPYRYAVDLADSGIHAEITGGLRAGMMRFRFAAGAARGWVGVEDNIRLGTGTIQIDTKHREISGYNPVYRIYQELGKPAGFSGYFVLQFDRPITAEGTWTAPSAKLAELSRHTGTLSQDGKDGPAGALVGFALGPDATALVRIGTSFTSIEEARANLRQEAHGWDFERMAQRTRAAWDAELSRVEISGESPQKTVFYTALYHALQLPRVYSDADGSYPRFAGNGQTEHAKGFTYYSDFSIWDTFRAVHPLLTLLDPASNLDMISSLLAMGAQGGFLPIFPAWNSYTSEMIGDHADAIIVDAYAKGLRGFDVDEAYALMKKNATETPGTALYESGRGRRALASYLRYGYIPLEDPVRDAFHHNEQVSRTLEYAYDDFLVAVLARSLGHAADADLFTKRSMNFRNVIDPETGFARGRHADGTWVTPFDPGARQSYITEGLPFQYTFFVPHAIPDLIALEHGRQGFTDKLDTLFARGYYDQGNEPSHHLAYLYDYAGAPEKTAAHVRALMALYRDAPDGLPGNDDAGQMSAWYVFSALGFYPVTPGVASYALGTPLFDRVRLHLPGGKTLTIEAPGAEAGQLGAVTCELNRQPVAPDHLQHADLIQGGTLSFQRSPTTAAAR